MESCTAIAQSRAIAFPFGSIGTLVAAVPRLMQFYPEESVVCVVLKGDSTALRVTARLDLPDPAQTDPLAHDVWWSALRDIARKVVQPGDLVHVLLLTAQPSVPVLRGIRRLETELVNRKASSGETIWVHDSRWSCLACARRWFDVDALHYKTRDDTEQRGCDVTGWGIQPTEEHRARLLLDEFGNGPNDDHVRRSRADLVAELSPTRPVLRVRGGRVEAHVREIAVAHAMEHLTSPCTQSIPKRDQELIVSSLMDVHVRDTVVFDLAHLKTRDWKSAVEHLRMLVVCTRKEARAATATVLATLRWQLGDGTRAHIALDAALEADPTYRLAHLLRAAVDSGMPPESWREGLLQLQRSTCLGVEDTAA
jgi:hypothetical protein